jgi:hypothetical protein
MEISMFFVHSIHLQGCFKIHFKVFHSSLKQNLIERPDFHEYALFYTFLFDDYYSRDISLLH